MDQSLDLDEYTRYGPQMILEGFSLEGQLKLKAARVAVVGAGGLGCPALQYLAAAGIGHIGIIDGDTVDLSNLQRQILYTDQSIGLPKARSAARALYMLNPKVKVDAITTALVPANAISLLSPYDVILDCTDNVPTRYLLSDTAVLLGKPLVSGAAQRYEGQLCIYNLGPDGPCYRCLFPEPPSVETIGTCAQTGILGVVTGIIGNMQALETLKLVTGLHDKVASLLLFSSLGSPRFRTAKLRKRNPTCPACGQVGQKLSTIETTDYVQFCGGQTPDWESQGLIARPDYRIPAMEFKRILDSSDDVLVIDVRPAPEYGICSLPGSKNIPLKEFVVDPPSYLRERQVFLICRLGNDSQIAASALRDVASGLVVKDVIGGLRAWAKHVDPTFPIY